MEWRKSIQTLNSTTLENSHNEKVLETANIPSFEKVEDIPGEEKFQFVELKFEESPWEGKAQ